MDNVTIKYGKGSLTLQKSDKLIGVRPSGATDRNVLRRLSLGNTSDAAAVTRLGGFDLIDVRNLPDPLLADGRKRMEVGLDRLRANESISAGTHVYNTSDDEVPFVPTGQLYVKFDAKAPVEECQQLIEDNPFRL